MDNFQDNSVIPIISITGKVWAHKTSLIPVTLYWSACTQTWKCAVMDLCLSGIDFASFYDFIFWFPTVVFFFILLQVIHWCMTTTWSLQQRISITTTITVLCTHTGHGGTTTAATQIWTENSNLVFGAYNRCFGNLLKIITTLWKALKWWWEKTKYRRSTFP
jgi:hypothetical protein